MASDFRDVLQNRGTELMPTRREVRVGDQFEDATALGLTIPNRCWFAPARWSTN
jgi:hypothetical protein